jgi:hypothetical protein
MNKKRYRALSILVTGCMLVLVAQPAAAAHEIVGAAKCKTCHKSKTGDQWKIWTESAHAGAFVTLGSPESWKIASERGLGDPQQEPACLKCHATRASLGDGAIVSEKGRYADSEGVGCEACHGPGSDYRPKKIMVDPLAARRAGLITDLSAEACMQCHNEDSPTYRPFDFEKRWAEIAHPVPGTDTPPPASSKAYPNLPANITFKASVGDVEFSHKKHVSDLDMECAECHHQIHAKALEAPHPDYMASSWSNCQTCHSTGSATDNEYYKCSQCHLSDLENIADETLSAKVVTHKTCWKCHESGTGPEASQGCVTCHVKAQE